MPEQPNGRATLRDILELQNLMHSKVEEIRNDLVCLKIQNAKNTAAVAGIVSILTSVIVGIILKFIGA